MVFITRSAVFGGVALFIVISIVAFGVWRHSQYELEADRRATETSSYTKQLVALRCARLSPIAKRICTIEVRRDQRSLEREERSLSSQEASAFWTFLMATVAILGMILSAVGVGLVYNTFGQAREANIIAREMAIAQVRPIFVFEHIDWSEFADRKWLAHFHWKNIGQGAAKLIGLDIGRETRPVGPLPDPNVLLSDFEVRQRDSTGTIVGVNDTYNSTPILVSLSDFYDENGTQQDVYLVARAIYIDAVGTGSVKYTTEIMISIKPVVQLGSPPPQLPREMVSEWAQVGLWGGPIGDRNVVGMGWMHVDHSSGVKMT